MKKINKILFILVVALIGFIGMNNVNAETIFNPDAYCGDFPKDGDSLITSCSSSGEESDLFDVTLMTWYKGDLYESSADDPGESVGTTGVYESGYQYYLELKFAPKAGNEISEDANFNIIGLSDGTIMDVAPNGEYIVVFEFTVHHIVSFETNGGTPIEDIIVTDWCSFDLPDDPVKDGYTFLGWYEDPDLEYEYWETCVEESMTLYAKYVETSKIINSINVTLEGPVIGQIITSDTYTDPEWGAVIFEQDPRPLVTAPNGANYTIDSTAWVQGICDYDEEVYLCDELFDGEIEADTYYYAEIGIESNENYAISSDASIKVNGEKPEEVFAVYENSYTRFIAKIKSKETFDLGYAFVSGVKNQTYNGKVQLQTNIIVKLCGKTLVPGTDYTVSYDKRIYAGTVTMTITGIGEYSGTKTVTFTRNKATNPLAVKVATKIVKYTKVKSKAQVVKPITVTKWAGTVTYKKISGSAKLTVNTKTGKITVKKGTKKGTYKVKVKIMASGNVNYKSTYGYRTITVKVK